MHFEGPEAVKFDYKEYFFQPTFHTCDTSVASFDRVLDAVKRSGSRNAPYL